MNLNLKSLVSVASISGLVVAIANTGNANAFSIEQLRQVITQNSEPPEVIINDTGSYTPSRSTNRAQAEDTRFTCELVDGEYTVMYYPESQPNEGYPWAIPSQLGGGWTPEKRCDAITYRFEEYREEGLLELATGTENGYDTICVTTQLDPTDCKIVLTVPPGQDPQLTRDLIFDNLLVADDGQQTQGVYTFGDRNNGENILGEVGEVIGGSNQKQDNSSPEAINLRPFLDPADGGTGQQLTKGNSAAPAPTPTPNNSDNPERKPDLFK